MSHWTAGSPSRKRVPETSGSRAEAPSLKRDGWMICWKNRQKKWSNLGAWSALQKALCRKTVKENMVITQRVILPNNRGVITFQRRRERYLRAKKMELRLFHNEDLV